MDRKENLEKVSERIKQAAETAGRDPHDIELLAVSKVFLVQDIKEIYDLGVRNFGESRGQELRDKAPLLPADIHWHFIGPLQTNKVKYVVPHSDLIHAVDSIKLARAISENSKKINKVQSILVEVNTSGEIEKHGFAIADALAACREINVLENIELRGLMTMAPYTDDELIIRKSFSVLRDLKEEIQEKLDLNNFNTLSMGMSGDFELAIKEGSTLVRLGTAIFGPRRRKSEINAN